VKRRRVSLKPCSESLDCVLRDVHSDTRVPRIAIGQIGVRDGLAREHLVRAIDDHPAHRHRATEGDTEIKGWSDKLPEVRTHQLK